MADLNSKDSSLLVGIVGVDSTTGETNPVNANSDGELLVKAKIINSNGTDITNANPLVISDFVQNKISYSASVLGLGTGLLATDIFTIVGSASKIVRVTRIQISATKTTSTMADIVLVKRSSDNTGGTSTSLTKVPLDSTNAAATATVRSYTLNPTLGTLVGNLRTNKMPIPTSGSTIDSNIDWQFGQNCQSIYLRGINEILSVNLNGVTLAGSSFNIFIEWTEE